MTGTGQDQSASALNSDGVVHELPTHGVSTATPQSEGSSSQVQPEIEKYEIVVSPGWCSTYDLYERKQIKYGCFLTFKYILTLMSFTSLITDPRVYNVTETPKDIIEKILGDVQDKRIMTFEQCLDCRKRSLECACCKFENSKFHWLRCRS